MRMRGWLKLLSSIYNKKEDEVLKSKTRPVLLALVFLVMFNFSPTKAVDCQLVVLPPIPTTPRVVEQEEPVDYTEEIVTVDEYTYDDYCEILTLAAHEYGVNSSMVVAISRLETGNFTSRAFLEGWNWGGLTDSSGVMEFEHIDAGLIRYVKLLAWYQEQGMDTPEKMASVYCPDNDSWAKLVRQLMKEME